MPAARFTRPLRKAGEVTITQISTVTVLITPTKLPAITLGSSPRSRLEAPRDHAWRFIAAVIDGVDSQKFKLVIGGSGNASIKRTCGDLKIATGGNAWLDATKPECQNVDLKTGGNADIGLYATGDIDASIAGNCDLSVFGNPQGEMEIHKARSASPSQDQAG